MDVHLYDISVTDRTGRVHIVEAYQTLVDASDREGAKVVWGVRSAKTKAGGLSVGYAMEGFYKIQGVDGVACGPVLERAVFVSPVRPTCRTRRWPYETQSVLFSDSYRTLHELAATLGLRSSWFRAVAGFPHYMLTEPMRQQALNKGAVPCTAMYLDCKYRVGK